MALRHFFSCAVPLCERPVKHYAKLGELLNWRNESRRRAALLGNTLVDKDGGPSAEDLFRELDWYLDDAAATKISWNSSCDDSNGSMSIPLRTSLEELDQGWNDRINRRSPFQYLVGCAHWRDLILSVQQGVLIPRPETEQIVDLAGIAISNNPALKYGIWADLGTGSGAIAIGIAPLLSPNGRVVAVDASDTAVAVAEANSRRCHVEDIVNVVKGSWFSPFENEPGKLAGVLSNPPYIPSEDISGLQAEVGKHEPHCALDGGFEGMEHLLLICNGACSALMHGGFLALETNGGKQAAALAEDLSTNKSFEKVTIVQDFLGIDRFVTAYHS